MTNVPGGYQPGARQSTRVAEQLTRRRDSLRARWKRDPGRELSLLLIFVVALATIFVAAHAAKVGTWSRLGFDEDGTYWMESAQRYRYAAMVAAGEPIPEVDARMQWPDGYPTRRDTIGQEALYGALSRDRGEGVTVAARVRALTRLFATSGVVAMALLAFAITRRRDAALLAALVYGLCLPVAERGNGATLFREDLAWPVALLHLAALAAWARRPHVLRALLAGLLLAGALLLWKVMTFHALLVVGLMAGAWWLGPGDPKVIGRDTLALFLPPALAALAPLSLRYDGFLTSTPLLAAVVVGVCALAASRLPKVPALAWPVVVLVLLGVVRTLAPSGTGYEHAWETIVAKLRTLDHKPLDPSELSFHARHYWTGNYESPTLRRLVRDWPWLGLLAAPGLVTLLREVLRREAPVGPVRPPPTKLLEGDGPLDPLSPLAAFFALWLVAGLLGAYLLFSKLVLFAATALAVLVALGFAAPKRLRWLRRLGYVLGALVVAAHGLGMVPSLERLVSDPAADADSWSEVVVYPPDGFSELVGWLGEETQEDEAVLASFPISPYLLTYVGRPTVLHCFFEGDLLTRLEDVVMSRFGTEEELWQAARRYDATWYVHEAQFAYRTDPRMSQRYVADAMEWPSESVTTRMQFAPETLEHFELAWENPWFRVFRVLDDGERARNRAGGAPLFDRELFTALYGDPLTPLGDVAADELLYATLQADSYMRYAALHRNPDDPTEQYAEQEYGLQRAIEFAPYLPEPHRELAALYRRLGKPDRVARHEAEARRLEGLLAGRTKARPGDRPRHVPRK